MDWTLILTAIGTVATVISTVVAVSAKNEAKKILKQIKEENIVQCLFQHHLLYFLQVLRNSVRYQYFRDLISLMI